MISQQQRRRTQGTERVPTCLIIEDSRFDQQRMTRMINKFAEDMQVYVATTLREARRTLAENRVSMILLDNNLPDGLGADFAIELADLKVFSHIPVVMVSDWPSPFMWEKAATAGVLHVVNKAEFGKHYLMDALRHAKTRQAPVH